MSVDGFVLLGASWYYAPPRPPVFPANPPTGTRIIAPFWTDLRRGSSSHIWVHLYYKYAPDSESQWDTNTNTLDWLASNTDGLQGFQPEQGIVITWENMIPVDSLTEDTSEVRRTKCVTLPPLPLSAQNFGGYKGIALFIGLSCLYFAQLRNR